LTGSIGVIIGKMYTPDMWKKIGVTFDSDQIGKNARLFSSLTRLDADQTTLLRRMLDSIYDTFVSRAAAGRKKNPEEIEPFAKGRVWTGEDALAHGLVDELGGYTAAFAEARKRLGLQPGAMVSLKFYPPEPNFFDYLLDRDSDDEVAATTGLLTDLSAGARKLFSLLMMVEKLERRENFELSTEPVDIR
ncbi:MAG TPA: S49 family peptidase, partial [bacterium]|nr:S49 family peptidase [bacterium]